MMSDRFEDYTIDPQSILLAGIDCMEDGIPDCPVITAQVACLARSYASCLAPDDLPDFSAESEDVVVFTWDLPDGRKRHVRVSKDGISVMESQGSKLSPILDVPGSANLLEIVGNLPASHPAKMPTS